MEIEEQQTTFSLENVGRILICSLKNQSIKNDQVSAELEKVGISYTQRGINKVYSQCKDRRHPLSNRKNNGREKIEIEEELQIVEHFQQNFVSVRSFIKDQQANPSQLSRQGVKNVLNRNGLTSFRLGRVLALNDDQMNERLRFATSVSKWKNKYQEVNFQDEAWFEIENNGMSHAWAQDKSDIPSIICKKINYYPIKIHLLGVIGYDDPIFIKQADGSIDSQVLIDFINESMRDDHRDKILLFDMAKFHTSNKTTEWLVSQNIEYLTIPPKAADINIIENIWSVLKTEVWKNQEQNMNKEQLFQICQTVFYSSPLIKQTIINGYKSLHKSIAQIIQQNGDLYKI